jgi:N-acetylneuraminic acid mutarotase
VTDSFRGSTVVALALLALACARKGGEVAGVAGTWQTLAPLPGGPRQECGTAAAGGKVYVIGGLLNDGTPTDRVEIYDPALDAWTDGPALPQPLHHPNVTAIGDRVLLVGAMGDGFVAGDVLVLEPGATNWTPLAPMPAGSERGAAAIAAIDGRIYLAGGHRGSSVGDASVFDPATGDWQTLPPLAVARDHLAGAALGGRFYAISGRQNGQLRGEVDALDPATGTWESLAPIPTPRGGIAAAVIYDRIHVLGGEGSTATSTGVFDEHEVFFPSSEPSGSWLPATRMKTARHGIGAATVGDRIYVPAGATLQGLGAVDVNEAFLPGGQEGVDPY